MESSNQQFPFSKMLVIDFNVKTAILSNTFNSINEQLASPTDSLLILPSMRVKLFERLVVHSVPVLLILFQFCGSGRYMRFRYICILRFHFCNNGDKNGHFYVLFVHKDLEW